MTPCNYLGYWPSWVLQLRVIQDVHAEEKERHFVCVHIDDIIIFSRGKVEHLNQHEVMSNSKKKMPLCISVYWYTGMASVATRSEP